jgi:hypothetical protein
VAGAAPCGTSFVAALGAEAFFAAAITVTFPTTESADIFARNARSYGFSAALIAGGGVVTINAVQAGGAPDGTEAILGASKCTDSNRPACLATMAALSQLAGDLQSTMGDDSNLSALAPEWGIFSVATQLYGR